MGQFNLDSLGSSLRALAERAQYLLLAWTPT